MAGQILGAGLHRRGLDDYGPFGAPFPAAIAVFEKHLEIASWALKYRISLGASRMA